MDKRFLTILAVIIVVLGGIFIFSKNSSDNKSSSSGDSSQATSHTMGDNKKNVVVVEYGDYQCPICGAYYSPIKEAVEKNKENISFQFRNLPLVSIHPNAFAAARAAEAAGLQNKYWEMHSKLYENQNQWSNVSSPVSFFKAYAKDLGLNAAQFDSDYSSSKVNDAINADLAAFKKTGKDQATPTIFINGVYVSNSEFTDPQTGNPSADKISAVIEAEIAKSNKN
jgi:protein-disulfide isomerase